MPHEEEKQVTLKNFLAVKHLKALGMKKFSLFSMLKKFISRACKIRVHALEPEISRGISKAGHVQFKLHARHVVRILHARHVKSKSHANKKTINHINKLKTTEFYF